MINQQSYSNNYPYLANFAKKRKSEEQLVREAAAIYKKGKPGLLEKAGVIPDRKSTSLVYNRRTKTGKMIVVRKGRRKKIFNPLDRGIAAGTATGAGLLTAGSIGAGSLYLADRLSRSGAPLRPDAALGLAAVGNIAGIGAGGIVGYKVLKKMLSDRGKKYGR